MHSQGFIAALICGLALGSAWLVTNTLGSAVLGWLFISSLVIVVNSKKPCSYAYLAGLTALPIGFYWLPYTLQVFGNFNTIAAYFLLTLFVAISAIQFIVFAFVFKKTDSLLNRLGLTTAVSWLVSEFIWIRIFPWEPAHTQLAWTHFVQIADLGGSALVTGLMFFTIESAYRLVYNKQKVPIFFAVIIFLSTIFYGNYKISWFENLAAPLQSIALVQANISTEEKHNITLFKRNTESYIELTNQLSANQSKDVIVIWPESVILDWLDDNMRKANELTPTIPPEFALLSGALTQNENDSFNSAIAIFPDGRMPAPYHKRILMPFGEYMPGAKLFPWIQNLNPLAAGFTAGTASSVFTFPMQNQTAKLSPLICYEDVVPDLSREAVIAGAQVLVNITNDAWFGNTQAPFQHNTIASFRAIENQRYLLRATNSGLSSVINPLGQIENSLPVFSDGHILQNIHLIDSVSWYTKLTANNLRIICLLIFLIILIFINKRSPTKL